MKYIVILCYLPFSGSAHNSNIVLFHACFSLIANYNLDSLCERGNTLLWDILQDGNIEQLADGLALEAEKAATR